MKKFNKIFAVVIAFSLVMAAMLCGVSAAEPRSTVQTSAVAGESGTVTITYPNIAGIEGEFTHSDNVTIDSIMVTDARGVWIEGYEGGSGSDIKIFAYNPQATITTLTITIAVNSKEEVVEEEVDDN